MSCQIVFSLLCIAIGAYASWPWPGEKWPNGLWSSHDWPQLRQLKFWNPNKEVKNQLNELSPIASNCSGPELDEEAEERCRFVITDPSSESCNDRVMFGACSIEAIGDQCGEEKAKSGLAKISLITLGPQIDTISQPCRKETIEMLKYLIEHYERIEISNVE
ncbi:unnamed protein product, partial [Mesorhabditis belari]|uniref:Uncharacterized protein n=1 Tax=Mesorhabditis belari TaxID=2138241 RepID=A0AAF3J8Y3_9BILA